jgi:hypothetical protein
MKINNEGPISLSSCFPGNIKAANNTGHQLRETKDLLGCCGMLFLRQLYEYLFRYTAVA